MRHHPTPCESLPTREHSRLTETKTNTSAPLTLALQCFYLSPGFSLEFPESCTILKLSRIPAFAMPSRTYKPNAQSRTIYPKPKRSPEDKPMPESSAHLRTQNNARCRSHMPRSSAHIQSHKQACSRKLSEQRKYREMASSPIFNNNTFSFFIKADGWYAGTKYYHLFKLFLLIFRGWVWVVVSRRLSISRRKL